MIKDIKYNGYTAQPSDYECLDGDLAISLNLIHEDGAIHSIPQPAPKFSIGSDRKLFIHRIGSNSNYIAYSTQTNAVDWVGSEKDGKFVQQKTITSAAEDIGSIINIASVGNILILSTTKNIFYIRFNAGKNAYVFLGSKIPNIFLDLALKLNFTLSDTQEKSFDIAAGAGGGNTTTGDNDWQTAIAVSYDVSTANGLLKREYVLSEKLRDTYVATELTPFPAEFKIDANVEYKLKWDVIAGCNIGMSIQIWGKRKGDTEHQWMCSAANEHAYPNTLEVKKSFAEDWTDIRYQIMFYCPDLSASYSGTKGNITWYKGIDNSDSDSDDVSTYIEYTSESHTALMGAINKFIKEQATDKARFIYPFFARYAIKLYDGSYSYISEPILMVPNSGYVPAVSFSKHSSLGTRLIMTAFAADIRYKVRGSIPKDWEDLITGIDLFVSQPVWPYNQGQNYDGTTNYFRFRRSVDSKGFGRAYFDGVACDDNSYGRLELKDYITRYATNVITNNYVQVAPRSVEDIRKDVVSVSNFYKICSLGLTQLNEARYDFVDADLEKGTLSTLVSRETLNDDTLQYTGFKDAYIKEYNNRLHICHSSILLRNPSHPSMCFNYLTDTNANRIVTYVYLATDDGAKSLMQIYASSISGVWFFYPDARAYKAAFCLEDSVGNVLGITEVDLKKHDFLNGAYWYAGDYCDVPTFIEATVRPSFEEDTDSIKALSTIYVSEANCPFVFKAISAVNVGAQEVLAVSSAAKALSQGQFGQFPLYAFTTEGIWALSVAPSGGYTAVQPIVRDETIDVESITQIDSALLFASKRGIMLLSGSDSRCISDSINSDATYDVRDLKGILSLHPMLQHPADSCLPVAPFSRFIANCRMAYDYPHQRIILYNTSKSYAYVYSLKSNMWGMMYSDLMYNVNSYPEALAINSNGEVVDFSEALDSTSKGLLISRPLKLNAPDMLKTVDTVIQRGLFRKGHVQSVLYGSRDLYNWHLVWSSKDHILRGFRGTPYKYFRIACVTSLSDDESIFGASLQFNPRQTNQPR